MDFEAVIPQYICKQNAFLTSLGRFAFTWTLEQGLSVEYIPETGIKQELLLICKQSVKNSLIRLFYYLVLSPFFNDIYYQIEMAIETLQKSDGLSTHRSSLLNSHVSCLFFTYSLSCLFCMLSLPLNVCFILLLLFALNFLILVACNILPHLPWLYFVR